MVKAFALRYNKKDVLLNSSSGGAFSAISDYVLSKEGVVYGAIYDLESNKVIHMRAADERGRNLMRGSKYLQSNMGNIYISIEKDLLEGKFVLFSGTACQVSGLKEFLLTKKIKMDKLITVDIICHGVTSPLIWKEYIEHQCSQKLKSINFRNKENGWNYSKAIAYTNSENIDLSTYMKLFYAHVMMRPSCHKCVFTSIERCSEITIGDFWGIEDVDINFDYREGVSFVMVNNIKGDSILKEILALISDIEYKQVDITDVRQPNLYSPTKASIIRKRFWSDYRKRGISYICKKYASESFIYKIIVILQKVKDSIFK